MTWEGSDRASSADACAEQTSVRTFRALEMGKLNFSVVHVDEKSKYDFLDGWEVNAALMVCPNSSFFFFLSLARFSLCNDLSHQGNWEEQGFHHDASYKHCWVMHLWCATKEVVVGVVVVVFLSCNHGYFLSIGLRGNKICNHPWCGFTLRKSLLIVFGLFSAGTLCSEWFSFRRIRW